MDRRKQLEDFFGGRLDEEQARELVVWLDTPDGEEFLSAEVLELWDENPKKNRYEEWDAPSLWEKINKNKKGYAKPVVLKDPVKPKRTTFRKWWAVAASFLILGFAGLFLFGVFHQDQAPIQLAAGIKSVERVNPAGQKTKILLPDGSTVYLNSGSKISYSEDFLTNRRIELEGEAFFKVVKDESHPFSVLASGITTTALGTSFNVNTFSKAAEVTVTLLTGKVKLNRKDRDNFLILNPGEESVSSLDQTIFTKTEVDVRSRILWVDGVLQFDQTALTEMVDELERWYGVAITVKGKPEHFLASGTFQDNETLRNVLDVLGSSIGFTFEINDKEVILLFN
ncbi:MULTISPECIES: FecR family protein [Rhodonellum]|nr:MULTISPECIES: FecR domain-containing protein [Rhodonellum]SDZ31433.1 FecR family protein [Rhodonellum ikkaensis]